ncbi:MAG TPA: helix-turn-helix transcriptional regulator [Polyangia bacterium]|nr:helix-turn-helix transcriptional regulator [Polyangia bacterium]
MHAETLKGHLDLLLLAAVEAAGLHGYAIIEQLNRRSQGKLDLAEGTVYPALHRLERGGLLRSSWAIAPDNGRKRRVYELTTRGRTALRTQQEEWRAFAQAMNAVLGGVS